MLQRSRLSPKYTLREAEGNIGELEPATLPHRLEADSFPNKSEQDTEAVFKGLSFAEDDFSVKIS